MTSLSPGAVGPLAHPMSPQGPFPTDGESLNIKQEPEDREPTFRSIGLQDITLDDGETFGVIFTSINLLNRLGTMSICSP